MGILNITPDSFFDGGQYQLQADILKRCESILLEGVEIIDIGAYSSRPGAENVSGEEELKRLSTALTWIRKEYPNTIISVDTFRASVAEEVVKNFEVDIINDIAAGELDNKMFETVARLNVPYVMMHMKGTPQSMQQNPKYNNLIQEISNYFAKKVEQLSYLGVNDIIIDPGFGFGKTLEHNYQLLKELTQLHLFQLPILVGVSRKSMIYKLLEVEPKDALNGTSVLNTVALLNGANILRVHDVKEAVECVKLVQQLQNA
ncbi:dihydropteroate synthase [Carboxylicivirga linearis]|uniref:dihydropteroate synthase n=2 Tax=Carboxylicivirga linearis TaxID=1628157 RepID=A0ABS5JW51_9BACT|nr:dihydropteroate synthase [Carboxylicivirga linearis]